MLRRHAFRMGRACRHRRGAIYRPRHWGRDAFPGFAPEAAAWLVEEREVAGIGGRHAVAGQRISEEFQTHQLWLPSGRWGLENVANLDKVPENGATLVVGAPKVRNATGGLTRLIALV